MRITAIAALLALALASQAWAADPVAGHRLADRWCSSCHAVDELHAGTGAPAFGTIAQRHGANSSWVRAWLMAPHPAMPDLNLSRAEIEDVVAYLDSLVPPKTN